MARIILVDDPPGTARAVAETLGPRGGASLETTFARSLAAAAAGEGDFVVVRADHLRAALAGGDAARDAALQETFQAFEDGVCLVDAEGRLEIANSAGERLYAGPLRDELEAAAREVMAGGSTADRSLALDGQVFAVHAYALPGRGAVLYVRDATDEREREIGRLQAEKLASIGLLAAGVAHEINNPAAFVLANIEALAGHLRLIEERLREPADPAAARRGLADVLFEANMILQESKEGMARIHRIVRDLGSFSHVDEEVSAPVNVNLAIDSALGMLRNELKYRARVERDLKASRTVRASGARLGQVFLNLILNAAQALDEAQAKRNMVRVRSYRRGPRRDCRGLGQRAGHLRRDPAAHLRVVLHDQAARHGDGAGTAHLAGDRPDAGGRDHGRHAPRRGRDVPRAACRPTWGACRRRPRHRRRRRRAGTRAAACWPSTTRRCC